jgi:hypothetical protein
VDALEADARVGDYRILRLIGRGGQGDVYAARDEQLGRKVALKILRPGAFEGTDAEERFLAEARATARFTHPNIVTLYGAGRHDGRPYVVLEYLDGESLRARHAAGRIGVLEALRIAHQIAGAVAEAHRRGVLHRDLKPENVVIPKDGRVRVVDFGLAVPVAPLRSALDSLVSVHDPLPGRSAGVSGTPAYMAPEQWLGEDVTTATDVFAFGVMLYELITRQRPFKGSTHAELAREVIRGGAAADLPITSEIGAELRRTITLAIHRDPGERPAMSEIRDLLGEALEGRARTGAQDQEPPFRGLFPFRDVHAHLFFGRDAELSRAVELLREEPTVPVVGPSGAGKSSFVQAGLVPRLREQGRWRCLSLRPGRRPFEILAERLTATLAGDDGRSAGRAAQIAALAGELAATPAKLGQELRGLAARERGRVLLFVDQLEELATLVDDPAERRAFLRALFSAADDRAEPLRVVITVREDFLGAIAEEPLTREALGRVLLLRPPGADALREIVTRPLQQAGYRFDQPELAQIMVAAVEREPAALPLLEFAALSLWERRDQAARLLRRADYDALGGVVGALAAHADGVLDALAPQERPIARDLFLRLVTPERTRRIERRSDLLAGLPGNAGAVLDRLIDARLLTLSAGGAEGRDDPQLELVHEALIQRWHRLQRWLDEIRDDHGAFDELTRAAELWLRRGGRADEVWTTDAIREVRAKVARLAPSLPASAGPAGWAG